jgi:N-acyl-D-amino-acid deacylase
MLKNTYRIFTCAAFILIASCDGTKTTEDVNVTDITSAWIIKNAVIYDGSGGLPIDADVRIKNGLIDSIGIFDPIDGEIVWDAKRLVLSPGFIDPHSHHDSKLMDNLAPASVLAQGITTIVSGMDGYASEFGAPFVSVKNVFAHFEKNTPAINLAFFGPHNTYRSLVMKDDYKRPATEQETEQMKNLLLGDLNAGALGLSTGLEYEPALYSDTQEIIALAKLASEHGGKYSSHIRSEDVKVTEAFDEVIRIAREANIPANISHIKLAMYDLYGDSTKVIEKLNAARAEGLDITADIYPYDGWQSTLSILIPSRDYSDRAAAEYALKSIAAPSTIIFARYEGKPEYIGKTLQQIADEANVDPVDMLMKLLQNADENDLDESIIGRNISEVDIQNFMKWPFTAITTDGGIDDRHPRGQGTYARVLARYVRDKNVLSLSEAIKKMTSLPAQNLGIKNRGMIKEGYAADLVVFDPVAVQDHATFEDPIKYSTGVSGVWVNGELVWDNGKATSVRPGQIIRREGQK